MKTPKKKMHVNHYESSNDDFMRKPVKKNNKRDRKISIYDAADEDEDFVDDFDDVYEDFDLDAFEEDDLDSDNNYE